jgi:site-specific recombinase XerD
MLQKPIGARIMEILDAVDSGAIGIGNTGGDGSDIVVISSPSSRGNDTTAALARYTRLTEEARAHVENSKADNTRRAYRADWDDFTRWCRDHDAAPLPAAPETVALYLTDCAHGLKASTIQRRMASITQAHAAAGYADSPIKHVLVRSVWRGIRREIGVAAQGKSPTLTADLRVMVDHLPGIEEGKLISVRDRALLLLGFAGAMRRSELVGLDVGDVLETRDGLVVTIRKSKTDQEGAGRKIGIPYGSNPQTCPVRAVDAWKEAARNALESSMPKAGNLDENSAQDKIVELMATSPLFRGVDRHGNVSAGRLSDQTVARVVKRALLAAGRNPEQVAMFAGHSLRAGLATQAAMSGASERSIQDQTGHKSLTILRRYIRDGSLFRENAAAKIGL